MPRTEELPLPRMGIDHHARTPAASQGSRWPAQAGWVGRSVVTSPTPAAAAAPHGAPSARTGVPSVAATSSAGRFGAATGRRVVPSGSTKKTQQRVASTASSTSSAIRASVCA